VQKAVQNRFLDASISVREAVVDLVGKFIFIKPEFINSYFEMIKDRILVRDLPPLSIFLLIV
jgi:hypothetical protein